MKLTYSKLPLLGYCIRKAAYLILQPQLYMYQATNNGAAENQLE
jgi:hypothetical protein